MFKRLIPAAFTPFKENLSLNTDAIPLLARWYRKQLLDTVFIGGTTGEFASLTVEERERLATAWLDHAKSQEDDLSIWVHVGSNCQLDAIRLAEHAQNNGASAISALAPSYFKPASVDTLINFLMPIADAAPELPFYYYEIPSMTGSTLPIDRITRLAIERIPTFAGVKFSSPDLFVLQLAMQAASTAPGRSIEFLFGVDEMLLGALPMGIDGAIGSTYNFAAGMYQELLRYYEKGDLASARAIQQRSVTLVHLFRTYGGISTGKAIMHMTGMPCGPVRPPLQPFTGDDLKQIFAGISTLSLLPEPLSPMLR